MLKQILIGGAVVVGGYLGYKWLTKPKTASGSGGGIEVPSGLTPREQENAAYIAQKFNPGYDVNAGMNGTSLAGAFGASPLIRVI